MQREFGSFDAYLWRFVDEKPRQNAWRALGRHRAYGRLRHVSKDLRRRGFTFVGTTICYAYMQAIGMVNDHLTTCYRYAQLGGVQ